MNSDFKPLIPEGRPIDEKTKLKLFGMVAVVIALAIIIGGYLSTQIGTGLLGSGTPGTVVSEGTEECLCSEAEVCIGKHWEHRVFPLWEGRWEEVETEYLPSNCTDTGGGTHNEDLCEIAPECVPNPLRSPQDTGGTLRG